MSAAEVSTFQDSLPPEKRPKDGETLARELVRANKLTKYQAQAVYGGNVKGLVFGQYVVLDKLGEGGMGVVLEGPASTDGSPRGHQDPLLCGDEAGRGCGAVPS
jgi:hypothetical protein